MAVVCKRNPDSIIKWQKSNSASSTASSRGSAPSVGAPHGAVHMMGSAPPAPYQQLPQQYVPGYYWTPPQLPAPPAPL